MTVLRIVANFQIDEPGWAALFYRDILGLDVLMDMEWIVTFGNHQSTSPQISLAREGGSSAPFPDVSIEVDNLDEVYGKMQAAGFSVSYSLTREPWGVRRFFVIDPAGRTINILEHAP